MNDNSKKEKTNDGSKIHIDMRITEVTMQDCGVVRDTSVKVNRNASDISHVGRTEDNNGIMNGEIIGDMSPDKKINIYEKVCVGVGCKKDCLRKCKEELGCENSCYVKTNENSINECCDKKVEISTTNNKSNQCLVQIGNKQTSKEENNKMKKEESNEYTEKEKENSKEQITFLNKEENISIKEESNEFKENENSKEQITFLNEEDNISTKEESNKLKEEENIILCKGLNEKLNKKTQENFRLEKNESNKGFNEKINKKFDNEMNYNLNKEHDNKLLRESSKGKVKKHIDKFDNKIKQNNFLLSNEIKEPSNLIHDETNKNINKTFSNLIDQKDREINFDSNELDKSNNKKNISNEKIDETNYANNFIAKNDKSKNDEHEFLNEENLNTISDQFQNHFNSQEINLTFSSIFIPIKEKMIEKEKIETELKEINEQLRSFDLIDLLEEKNIKVETVSPSLIKSILDELVSAIEFFKYNNENGKTYLEKAININEEMRMIALRRILEEMHKNSTILLKNNEARELMMCLDDNSLKKIKLRYLRIRKMNLVTQIEYFKRNFSFLAIQAVKQEFNLYFKIFKDEFRKLNIKEENMTNVFECFIFSFLRLIFEKMELEEINKIRIEIENKVDLCIYKIGRDKLEVNKKNESKKIYKDAIKTNDKIINQEKNDIVKKEYIKPETNIIDNKETNQIGLKEKKIEFDTIENKKMENTCCSENERKFNNENSIQSYSNSSLISHNDYGINDENMQNNDGNRKVEFKNINNSIKEFDQLTNDEINFYTHKMILSSIKIFLKDTAEILDLQDKIVEL